MIMIRNIDMIARYVVRLQDKPDRPPTTLSPEDCSTLARVLDDIERLPQMTSAIEREHKLLPLKSLHFDCKENVENVAPILFQIRGLSRLTILRTSPEERTDETDMQRRELAVALALQTETLVDLVVDGKKT